MRVANLAVIQLFTDDNMAANTPKVVSFGFKNYDDFDPQSQNVLQFWFVNKTRLNKLLPLALRIFSVPASSAPIERVFSHGGIIMRPHRARLGDTMLSKLIFLKCNNLYEIQSQ